MREKPRDVGRLRHIAHAIDNIVRFTQGVVQEDFRQDSLLYFGVVKNLEIIGEAAYMLTEEFKEAHPLTPWRSIIGMRHILVHGYYQVDPAEVWETVVNDLPPLDAQVRGYIEELSL